MSPVNFPPGVLTEALSDAVDSLAHAARCLDFVLYLHLKSEGISIPLDLANRVLNRPNSKETV